MSEQMGERDQTPMPMCGDCQRPLGLFYAECPTCMGSADLFNTYYDQWCEWQTQQRVVTPPGATS